MQLLLSTENDGRQELHLSDLSFGEWFVISHRLSVSVEMQHVLSLDPLVKVITGVNTHPSADFAICLICSSNYIHETHTHTVLYK